jgi:hypothetical protein
MENSQPQPSEPPQQFSPAPPEQEDVAPEVSQPAGLDINTSVQLPSDPSPHMSQSILPSDQTQGPVVFGPSQHGPLMHGPEILQAPKRKLRGSKKGLLIGALAAVLLIGTSAGAFFGYYLPNKPENLWGASLVNMGKGYDKLADYAKNYQSQKGNNFKGSFKASGDFNADGSLEGSSDTNNGQYTANVSAEGLKISLEVRAIKSNTSTPDIYIKTEGVSDIASLLGADEPDLSKILQDSNGKWYFIDHTLVERYLNSSGSQGGDLSKQDVNDFIKAIEGPSKKYVFTNDPNKMVFVIKQKIGSEKQDSRNTYHYKIGVNKANLKAYNHELCDSLKDTKLYKLLGDQTTTECQDASDIDNIKDSDSTDVWVDKHTRLVHKVRFYQSANDANNYYDLIQDYQGGDKLPFSVNVHNKSSNDTFDAKLNMTLGLKDNSITIDGNMKGTGSSKINGSLNLTVTPNSKPVNPQKPDGAVNIMQLLGSLGLSDLGADSGSIAGSSQQRARDAERKSDIRALESKVAEYYALNGYYPVTLAVIDGIPAEACKAPGGSGTCAKPDYIYKAFKTGTAAAITSTTNCDNKKNDCVNYIIYTPGTGAGAMETQTTPYSVAGDEFPPTANVQ